MFILPQWIIPQWNLRNSSAHSLGQEVGFRNWEGHSCLARLHRLGYPSSKRDPSSYDLWHPWEHWVSSSCISWAFPEEPELWGPPVNKQCALIQEGWDCLFSGKWSKALVFQGNYWITSKPQKSVAKIAWKFFSINKSIKWALEFFGFQLPSLLPGHCQWEAMRSARLWDDAAHQLEQGHGQLWPPPPMPTSEDHSFHALSKYLLKSGNIFCIRNKCDSPSHGTYSHVEERNANHIILWTI